MKKTNFLTAVIIGLTTISGAIFLTAEHALTNHTTSTQEEKSQQIENKNQINLGADEFATISTWIHNTVVNNQHNKPWKTEFDGRQDHLWADLYNQIFPQNQGDNAPTGPVASAASIDSFLNKMANNYRPFALSLLTDQFRDWQTITLSSDWHNAFTYTSYFYFNLVNSQ